MLLKRKHMSPTIARLSCGRLGLGFLQILVTEALDEARLLVQTTSESD